MGHLAFSGWIWGPLCKYKFNLISKGPKPSTPNPKWVIWGFGPNEGVLPGHASGLRWGWDICGFRDESFRVWTLGFGFCGLGFRVPRAQVLDPNPRCCGGCMAFSFLM